MIPDVTNISGLKPAENLEPRQIATKVQAMFMEVMIKAMEDSVEAEGGLFGNSSSSEIYRGMMREQLANAVSGQMNSALEGQLKEAMEKPEKKVESENLLISSNLQPAAFNPQLPVSGRVTSMPGWRLDPINGIRKFHKGTDIAAPRGTEIKAVADGRVVESGRKGGYGNTVVIETDDGRKMLYAHNQKNFVRIGDRVQAGDVIASVGSTGRSTGPHVHFEVVE